MRFWRVWEIGITLPNAVKLNGSVAYASQEINQSLSIAPVAKSAIGIFSDNVHIIDSGPTTTLKGSVWEVAAAAGGRTDILHLRQSEVGPYRCLSLGEVFNAEVGSLFSPLSSA